MSVASKDASAHVGAADVSAAQGSALTSAAVLGQEGSYSTSAPSAKAQGVGKPVARMETTGMMASMPELQGSHIRFDSSGSESVDISPSLQPACPEAPRTDTASHGLNSVDQHKMLDAVAAATKPDPDVVDDTSASIGTPYAGKPVGDLVADAMQGIIATTVLASAESEQAVGSQNTASSNEACEQAAVLDPLGGNAPDDLDEGYQQVLTAAVPSRHACLSSVHSPARSACPATQCPTEQQGNTPFDQNQL